MELKINTYLNTLFPFFENPEKQFGIRELARILKVNHTTIRQHLNKLVKEGFLELKKENNGVFYKIVFSRKFLNLKLYYNLEKLRQSKLIEELEKSFDFPVIVVFGSYAYGRDTLDSDIDFFIVTNVKKDLDFSKFEKILNRKIEIHKFSEKAFENAKNKNPELINSICNGIVLSGELEVLK